MTSDESMYDEQYIRAQLETCTVNAQVAFAASCAEWLYPCYEHFAPLTDQGDPVALRGVIDAAWSVSGSETLDPSDAERLAAVAESLVPEDSDDNSSTLSPIAQNAAACAAYA